MSNIIKYPTEAGIYKLTCNVNQKIYIGKSVNLSNRLLSHKYSEKKLKGRCYFENAMIKYGWNSFSVEILDIFKDFDKLRDNKSLLDLETHYIKLFDSCNKEIGYNIQKHSNDSAGNPRKPLSEKNLERLRNLNLGRKKGPLSEETRKKISESCVGRKHSEESMKKMRLKKLSPEHREILASCNIGRKHSTESKDKMRNSTYGKTHSEETKNKMRMAKLGKPLSKEHVDKIKLTKANKILNKITEENIII
jgi:group I intron endonuclease